MEHIGGKKKAAMLLCLLGDEISSQVLKRLDTTQIQDLSQEISQLHKIDPQSADSILEEFYRMQIAGDHYASGGLEYARRLLVKSVGRDASKGVLDSLARSVEMSTSFEHLEKTNPQQIIHFIQNEHPQTIALILAHLSTDAAAGCLEHLPSNLKAEVTTRLAALDEIDPEVVKKVSLSLKERLSSLGTYSLESCGGVRTVADILNKIDREVSRDILERIEVENPEMATKVRDLMFTFEDMNLLDDPSIVEILKRVTRQQLAMAMKGATEELRSRILNNMSQRAGSLLTEEMEYLGPVKVRDVEHAQQDIVSVVRQLEDDGVIGIGGGSADEFIV